MSRYALFDTSIGPMALAWGPHGVVACELPARSPAHLEARFARRHERAAPDGFAAEVIARLRNHLAGQPDALLDVALDLRATPAFAQRVYALTRAIAPGDTRTYGQPKLSDLVVATGRYEIDRTKGFRMRPKKRGKRE